MKINPFGMTEKYKEYKIKFLGTPHLYEIYKDENYITAVPTLSEVKRYINEGIIEEIMKSKIKKNPPYGYGREYDNPMKQDDMARALHTINYTFNTINKHVTVGGEAGQFHVYVTDLSTDDIIRTWGPISKDSATYILLGMLETIKIVRYE